MGLKRYQQMRDFERTPEPSGRSPGRGRQAALKYVIQEHHARRLHFDLRLEWGGVLKSWAVTSEPSMVIGERHLAVETEDHPLEYGKFEGEIPRGEYGAGSVMIWDRGTYVNESGVSVEEALERGKLEILLRGSRLRGRFVLVRMQRERANHSEWLFFRMKPKVKAIRVPSIPERRGGRTKR